MSAYLFTLDAPATYSLPEFRDFPPFNADWLSVVRGVATVPAGYSWDGATLAPTQGKKMADGHPQLYFPSNFHDAFYQQLEALAAVWQVPIPWLRAQIDWIFLRMMRAVGFDLAVLYYVAVRLFGGLYHDWHRFFGLTAHGRKRKMSP